MIRNFTGESILLIDEDGKARKIPASGKAELRKITDDEVSPEGILITSVKGYEVVGLPPEERGTKLIVSLSVFFKCCDDRNDLLMLPMEAKRRCGIPIYDHLEM